MAEIPPQYEVQAPPPVQPGPMAQYAAYPRTFTPYLDPEKLRALSRGYFGLNWVFVANVLLALVAFVLLAIGGESESPIPILLALAVYPLMAIVIGALAYPQVKRIGFGLDWSPNAIIGVTVLMGFNAVCTGIVGYIVLQLIVGNEMKKRFGVRSGFFGIRGKDVRARVGELEAAQATPTTHSFQA